MAVGKKPAAGPLKGKKKSATFVIDCSKPVEDKIMKIGEFEKFLVDKIKVDNKTGTFLSYVSFFSRASSVCVPCLHPEYKVADTFSRDSSLCSQASLETWYQWRRTGQRSQ